MMRRQSGIAVPLFSLASGQGWGIGEFADLPEFANWLAEAGQSVLQILPIHEMPPIESSPYSAMTAMALDPIYLSMLEVPDFAGLGGEQALDGAERAEIVRLRQLPRIDYAWVRRLKARWLRRSFDRFLKMEVARGSPRALRFDSFRAEQSWWLEEYALFRALHAMHGEQPWTEWPAPLASADPDAVGQARASLHLEITYRSYLQWLAWEQWGEARRKSWPLKVFGDLPFMISADSPDVWARQQEFRFDATIGVPPDAFSETGQDWGLPPWRADVMAATGFGWMRARARRYAELYDGYRIDHLVGFYRTFVIPADGSAPAFSPAEPRDQLAQGERVMHAFLESGARIIAEDLGTVPDFIRESLLRLGIAGYKVLRWERDWNRPGQPFRNPQQYPQASVATTGTHDTDTLAEWWESASVEERAMVAQIPLLASRRLNVTGNTCDATTRDSLLESLVARTT
jgi:4-alpha-glucanotransferase